MATALPASDQAEPKLPSEHSIRAFPVVEKNGISVSNSALPAGESPSDEDESNQLQDGVKQVEAVTTVWSKQLLIVMFILYFEPLPPSLPSLLFLLSSSPNQTDAGRYSLYLVAFFDTLLQSVQGNLVPYITSSFRSHGLLATTSIVATILGGVSKLTIAKVIDIWGRCEGFVVMLVLVVVGMVMKALSTNVETYAAAHCLYWVGHIGIQYVITVMLADMTSLRNRLILFGLQSTPRIASTFAGPRIADLFYTYVNFRWAFGAFCIILVTFCIPVILIFFVSKRKAFRMGLYPPRSHDRTVWQSCKHYFVQFDGLFFCSALPSDCLLTQFI